MNLYILIFQSQSLLQEFINYIKVRPITYKGKILLVFVQSYIASHINLVRSQLANGRILSKGVNSKHVSLKFFIFSRLSIYQRCCFPNMVIDRFLQLDNHGCHFCEVYKSVEKI